MTIKDETSQSQTNFQEPLCEMNPLQSWCSFCALIWQPIFCFIVSKCIFPQEIYVNLKIIIHKCSNLRDWQIESSDEIHLVNLMCRLIVHVTQTLARTSFLSFLPVNAVFLQTISSCTFNLLTLQFQRRREREKGLCFDTSLCSILIPSAICVELMQELHYPQPQHVCLEFQPRPYSLTAFLS